MPEVFFIADTHFGHKGIINFESTKPFRPFDTIEEHNEEIIRRWNAKVTKNDNVWHLGDFCFGKHNLEIAARLNGTKRLVMGNHDQYAGADYLRYFTRICGASEFDGCILTHIPVHPSQFERYRANIHGHLHTNRLDDSRYINVSCEQISLTPISYSEIKNSPRN